MKYTYIIAEKLKEIKNNKFEQVGMELHLPLSNNELDPKKEEKEDSCHIEIELFNS